MVYSMQQGTFPQDLNSDRDDLHLHNIDLQHIHQFVELNQVGYRDKGSLWMHTDPDNRRAKQAQVTHLLLSTGSARTLCKNYSFFVCFYANISGVWSFQRLNLKLLQNSKDFLLLPISQSYSVLSENCLTMSPL